MPTLKNIAVLFDASPPGLHILETAARLAGGLGSHLIGVTAMDQGPEPPHQGSAAGGAVAEALALHQSIMASRLLASGQRLNGAVQRHASSAELRIISFAGSSSESALHALSCDLLVLSSPKLSGTPRAWEAHTSLLRTGRPILIVPRAWADKPIARKIVVAWNGSEHARRAIVDALPLLTAAEVVKLLVIAPENQADLPGDPSGVEMASFLAGHRVAADVAVMSSNGASTDDRLQAYAASVDAGMLVIGTCRHARDAASLAEDVTSTLLADAALPLFVSQ
ncbi:universal stress protein [Xanthomonas arboricola]|uniref:universal stress protein n=1 Tax=Xanthomonas arboricola TaxID=56448 RepID=UPI000E0E57D6|nr:universal stress protein [Xanthomonas arboricola]